MHGNIKTALFWKIHKYQEMKEREKRRKIEQKTYPLVSFSVTYRSMLSIEY